MPSLARRYVKRKARNWVLRWFLAILGVKLLLAGFVVAVTLLVGAVAVLSITDQKQRQRDEEAGITRETSRPGSQSFGAPTGAVAPISGGGAIDVGTPDPARAQNGVGYSAAAAIDFDGDPYAYAPADSGLATSDYLANAGRPGKWWGIKTDTGRSDGNPVVRSDGYYTSTTSLSINGKYLDSQRVPFVALPNGYGGAKLGDYALVTNNETGARIWAIFGDVSPKQSKVEVSAAAARGLGVGFVKQGVTSNGGNLTVTVYPGSANLELLRSRIN